MKPIKKCFCLLCAAFVLSPAFAESDSEKNTALTVENRDVLETNNPTNPRDPWESFNRKMFAVHTVLYENIGKPVGTVYDKAVPLPVHSSLNNAFGNFSDLWGGANHLLQGKASHAGSDVLRFLINSTLGILGIFDVASEMGIHKNDADFGQTLAKWGVPNGNYLFIPAIGPKYTRDALGWAVDSNPMWWVLSPIRTRNVAMGVDVLEMTAQVIPLYRVIGESGLDPYVMIRESYFQRRQAQLLDGESVFLEEDDDYSKE